MFVLFDAVFLLAYFGFNKIHVVPSEKRRQKKKIEREDVVNQFRLFVPKIVSKENDVKRPTRPTETNEQLQSFTTFHGFSLIYICARLLKIAFQSILTLTFTNAKIGNDKDGDYNNSG